MEWKDIVELKKENALLRMKLNVVNTENEGLKENLAKKEKEYRLLGEYYEASLQVQDEMADLCWEKDEEIEANKDFIKELSKTNEVALNRLTEAGQKIVELEKQVALLQQQKCRAEGKLDKVDNYLRIVYGEGVDRYGKY